MRTAIAKLQHRKMGLPKMVANDGDHRGQDLVQARRRIWTWHGIQIPLSRRMHILGSIGYRNPVNNMETAQTINFYLLWTFQTRPKAGW